MKDGAGDRTERETLKRAGRTEVAGHYASEDITNWTMS